MSKITVTSPLLPPLEELTPYLEDIWSRKWLTNNGHYHQKLETALCKYLNVPYISLFANGTLALITALQALELSGEVITTPYTFAATSNAIKWNNLKPIFVDIDPLSFNIDVSKIEAAITDKTTAILPVHVYGNPCDHSAIEKIAKKHNLKVIYDAAHAFGVKKNGDSILNFGELSILSFHATKTYSTIEGGAVVCHNLEMKQRLDTLKNFGFESETQMSMCGFNAKLNEIQAAFGLVSLLHVDGAIARRKKCSEFYFKYLKDIKGIALFQQAENVIHNYSYFPILVDESEFNMSRDELLEKFQQKNIFVRKYFYPLVSEFDVYEENHSDTLHAKSISSKVLCLPIHDQLSEMDLLSIIKVVNECQQ